MGQVSSNFNLLTLEYAPTYFFFDFVFPLFARYCSMHKNLLRKQCVKNVEQRHTEQFVGWFERKVKYNFLTGFIACSAYVLIHCSFILLADEHTLCRKKNK